MKKKVLIITSSLTFSRGAPKVAAALTMSLSSKYNVSTLTFHHSDKLYPFKGTYFSINEKSRFSHLINRLIKLYYAIKFISPDIIITFMSRTSFWLIPLKYIFNLNMPLIIDVTTNPNLHYKKRIYGKFLVRYLFPLKKANAIVPVSKELKEIFNKDFKIPNNKIIPIYNSIDVEKIQKKAQEKVDDFEEVFNDKNIMKFITVGRLSGEKGHRYLIEAYSKVIKEIPNSRLFIIGEGTLRRQLEELITVKELKKYVILLGSVKNPYNYISRANIFVLPSLHEGLPYVLLEALACKTPIISTDCKTGPKEILENGEYGLLVNTADSNDLANKMIQLAKDKTAREVFSKRSAQQVKIFDKKKFTDNWVNLIEYYLTNA